eukprot:4653016-Pyramimonas_sp.AAC.1
MLHGTTVPPERAEELRQADLDLHEKQRRAGLGRWRAAFPAHVQYPTDGLYPAAMFAAAFFSESEAKELLRTHAYEIGPTALSAYTALFNDPPQPALQEGLTFSDRYYRYRPQDFSGPAAEWVPMRVHRKEIVVLNLFSGRRREGD